MKLVCVKCEVELRPEHNGVLVEEMLDKKPEVVGTSDAFQPRPYRLWHADKYKCPSCGMEVVTGFGAIPVAQHNEDNYTIALAHWLDDKDVELIHDYPL